MIIFIIFIIAAILIVIGHFYYSSKDNKIKITKRKIDKRQSFAELLNYASLVESGIILTTEGTLIAGFYFKGEDAQGFTENKDTAKEGGDVAGKARKDLEERTKTKVISKDNYLSGSKRKKIDE